LNFIHLGMRNGGGIGDSIPRVSFKYMKGEIFAGKLIYEHCFYLLIDLIFINLVLGEIVESFNEIRSQENIKIQDKENKCFICDIDRYYCKEDFEEHRKKKHYLFDYIYVYLYLTNINTQELTPAETYILGQINSQKTDWFPVVEDNENKSS